MTEQTLVEGLLRNDRAAQRELYERYAAPLMALCLRYMGVREAAEDLLHDGFLQAYAKIGSFHYRGEGSLRAWLSRMFTNMALMQLRHKDLLTFEPDDTLPDMPADDDPPDVSMETILRLMATLPAGYRAVLNLYLVEGWSHRDIARQLGISESTSASQYLRARQKLKQKIQQYLNTHDT